MRYLVALACGMVVMACSGVDTTTVNVVDDGGDTPARACQSKDEALCDAGVEDGSMVPMPTATASTGKP